MQSDVALGQLLPGGVEAVQGQPAFQAALHGLVAGEALGQELPADAGDQEVQQGMQARAVALGFTADALPDDRGQNRLEQGPDVVGDVGHEVGQFHRWGLQGVPAVHTLASAADKSFVR